jgi:hypothetical protein
VLDKGKIKIRLWGRDLGNNEFFTWATSGASIQRIGIFQIQNVSIDGAFLENLQFSKHIPEPSAPVRVSLGFMGFIRLRRTVKA